MSTEVYYCGGIRRPEDRYLRKAVGGFCLDDPSFGATVPHRLDLVVHSPTGVSWGDSGPGSAQCALALLADLLGDDDRAVRLHQDFKNLFVAGLRENCNWSVEAHILWALVDHLDQRGLPPLLPSSGGGPTYTSHLVGVWRSAKGVVLVLRVTAPEEYAGRVFLQHIQPGGLGGA